MSEMVDAALRYARRGWAVSPCKPGSKESATMHGVYDARFASSIELSTLAEHRQSGNSWPARCGRS
jgi:hypothetical protein